MPIDLNSDLGEGYGPWTMGDDAAMLDIVSSANIACGFHAGDPAGLLAVLRQAAARGVAVGAQVRHRAAPWRAPAATVRTTAGKPRASLRPTSAA